MLRYKSVVVKGIEILADHVYTLLNHNPQIRYDDFMNRVKGNWKKEFTVYELTEYANKPIKGR